MENKKGIFKAFELAGYIKYKYNLIEPDKNISPLKLQKALYFCFAYWGGFASKGNNSVPNEVSVNKLNPYLFDDKIEAWVYGPVVPSVYYHQDEIKTCNLSDMFDTEEKKIAQNYIDGVLEDVLNTSDFRLVAISHEDNCWKHNYKPKVKIHNKEIPKEKIIFEYEKKI